MLRRNQSNAQEIDRDEPEASRPEPEPVSRPQPEPIFTAKVDRRKAEREDSNAWRPEVEVSFSPKADRRKTERQGMDALRADALRSVISRVEDKNFGGLRNRFQWRRGMKPSRILLLAVALLAGGLAAFLATLHEQPIVAPAQAKAVQEKIIQEPRTQILIAKQAIGMGQRLSSASVEWQDWPQGAVLSDYVTVAAQPQAIGEMTGTVARFEILAGEPIRGQKLVKAAQGYLSAVLDGGMRGVSVSVAAESASGGFIVPNDHVDVVLARSTPAGQTSATVLHNVRVLAINARLGETGATGAPTDASDPRAEMFKDTAIATLELDPTQAEVIANATTQGKLSLVLRAIVDSAEANKAELSPTNQTIRMTSPFWAK